MKLYIVSNTETGMGNIEGRYTLISEDGELLYSHYCGCKKYAKYDLIENRKRRQLELCKKYGHYQVLYLGEDDMTYKELINRNSIWYHKNKI